MPVSINFDKPVKNKKAVESAIKVASSSNQKVVGHWFDDKRLDFRPQEYWKANSKVTMKLGLDDVEASPGVKGIQNKTVSFNVGHSQVSTVDTKAHEMTVVRDGKTVKTIPISAGSEEHPTYNGQMVISERFKQTRMDGSTVGFKKKDGKGEYDIPDVPHAMRLSDSGTFIHGNYWGKGIFGKATPATAASAWRTSRAPDDSVHGRRVVLRPLADSATSSRSSTPRTRPSSPTTASTAGTWTGRSGSPAAPCSDAGHQLTEPGRRWPVRVEKHDAQ